MEMGQCVKTLDGSLGIIVAINGAAARVCYLAPNRQLSYITDTFLLQFLTEVPDSAQTEASPVH
jgi:hypothetical protein